MAKGVGMEAFITNKLGQVTAITKMIVGKVPDDIIVGVIGCQNLGTLSWRKI